MSRKKKSGKKSRSPRVFRAIERVESQAVWADQPRWGPVEEYDPVTGLWWSTGARRALGVDRIEHEEGP